MSTFVLADILFGFTIYRLLGITCLFIAESPQGLDAARQCQRRQTGDGRHGGSLGGFYGLRKGYWGQFANYVTPVVKLEHNARNNRVRAV